MIGWREILVVIGITLLFAFVMFVSMTLLVLSTGSSNDQSQNPTDQSDSSPTPTTIRNASSPYEPSGVDPLPDATKSGGWRAVVGTITWLALILIGLATILGVVQLMI